MSISAIQLYLSDSIADEYERRASIAVTEILATNTDTPPLQGRYDVAVAMTIEYIKEAQELRQLKRELQSLDRPLTEAELRIAEVVDEHDYKSETLPRHINNPASILIQLSGCRTLGAEVEKAMGVQS